MTEQAGGKQEQADAAGVGKLHQELMAVGRDAFASAEGLHLHHRRGVARGIEAFSRVAKVLEGAASARGGPYSTFCT